MTAFTGLPARLSSIPGRCCPARVAGAEAPQDTPVIMVRIGFASNPGDESQTWTNVSDYVRDWDFSRGRTSSLDRFEAGVGRVTLTNTDRRFEPQYADGLYYPDVDIGKVLQITEQTSMTIRPVFTGDITRWKPNELSGLDAVVVVTAVDGLAALSRGKLIDQAFSAELSGDRVGHALDAIGWPSSLRSIATGQSTMAAGTVTSAALSHMQDVQVSEGGRLFADGGGTIVFHDRYTAATTSPYDAPVAAFGSGSAELPWTKAPTDYTDSLLYTQVSITPSGGTAETVTSASGTTAYRLRTLTQSVLFTSQTEARDSAYWKLDRYGTPRYVVGPMEIDGRLHHDLWGQVVYRDIGDQVEVLKRPQGGSAVTFTVAIEKVHHWYTYPAGELYAEYELSPADAHPYWELGVAELGVGTYLIY